MSYDEWSASVVRKEVQERDEDGVEDVQVREPSVVTTLRRAIWRR